MHAMKILGDVGHVESHFGPFGMLFVFEQDRCTVCVEGTMGS
jgi:hypothetical protein